MALALLSGGVDVCCLTTSDARFAALAAEAAAAARGAPPGAAPHGALLRARGITDGVWWRVWVVGKSDPDVRRHLPRGAVAVVFAVPCPLSLGAPRRDVSVIDGGLLRLDVARCAPRSPAPAPADLSTTLGVSLWAYLSQ